MPTRDQQATGPIDRALEEAYRHAFRVLAAAETGLEPSWSGPTDFADLASRVSFLAWSRGLVPRDGLVHLDDFVRSWHIQTAGGRSTADELRDIARAGLLDRQPGGPDDAGLRRALSVIGAEGLASPSAAGRDGSRARERCAAAVRAWHTELTTDERWTHLPSVIPDDAPLPIDQVYVDLYALPSTAVPEGEAADIDRSRRLARRLDPLGQPVVSVPTMLSRTADRTVVVGEPGSGKSTLVQWIAWSVATGRMTDFDLAVVVKLRSYAAALAGDDPETPLTFFFRSLGLKPKAAALAAEHLRSSARATRRILLLLDGWDEVPSDLRAKVRHRLLRESHDFVTLITSRPSGLPHSLRDGRGGQVYELAGLSQPAVEGLARNLFVRAGRPQLTRVLLQRLEEQPDLRGMCGNPFLLTLVARVAAAGPAGSVDLLPRTRAAVYEQAVEWMREQYNRVRGARPALVDGHLTELRALCHDLLFTGPRPSYVFRGEQLRRGLAEQSLTTEPVLGSRLVDSVGRLFDEHAFIHATFQEYFAARALVGSDEGTRATLLNLALNTGDRHVVLEFVAGLDGSHRERFWQQVADWGKRRDRFGVVERRLANLVAAARLPEGGHRELGYDVRDLLWTLVRGTDEPTTLDNTVTAFAVLDPDDLVARAAAGPRLLGDLAVQCVVTTVPWPVAERSGLHRLLDGPWRDFRPLANRAGAGEEEAEDAFDQLRSADATPDEKAAAARALATLRAATAVPEIVSLLQGPWADGTENDQREVLYSLGELGGRSAVDAVLDELFGTRLVPDVLIAAVDALRVPSYGAIDPDGRDRVLRRVATLDPKDPRLSECLMVLEGLPIREGGEVLLEVLHHPDALPEVRLLAAEVLAGCSDPAVVANAVAGVKTEKDPKVALALLRAARARQVRVDGDWLRRQVVSGATTDVADAALGLLLALEPPGPSPAGSPTGDLLATLLPAVLADPKHPLGETLLGAGDRLPARCEAALVEHVRRFRDAPLGPPGRTNPKAAGALSRIDRRRGTTDSADLLVAALDSCLEAANRTRSEAATESLSGWATYLALALVKLDPLRLLPYPRDTAPVRAALQEWAQDTGHLVFDDRITGPTGETLGAPVKRVSRGPVRSFGDLVRALPDAPRRSVASYWAVVGERGVCPNTAPLGDIYKEIDRRVNGTVEDAVAESLDDIYEGSKLPSLSGWKKAIERLEDAFEEQEDVAALDLLRDQGLCRRLKFGSY